MLHMGFVDERLVMCLDHNASLGSDIGVVIPDPRKVMKGQMSRHHLSKLPQVEEGDDLRGYFFQAVFGSVTAIYIDVREKNRIRIPWIP